jgi:hypothetical protein
MSYLPPIGHFNFAQIGLYYFALTKKAIVFAVVISMLYFSYFLLNSEKISGDNFVFLFFGIAVFGLIFFLSNVEELGFGSFLVKFSSIQNEAERTLEGLKKARVDFFKMLLRLRRKTPGGIRDNNATKDVRLKDFWDIVDSIKSQQIESQLTGELIETASIIKAGQFDVIRNFINLGNEHRQEDSKEILSIIMEKHPEYEKRKYQGLSESQKKEKKKKMLQSLEEYQDLERYIDELGRENHRH